MEEEMNYKEVKGFTKENDLGKYFIRRDNYIYYFNTLCKTSSFLDENESVYLNLFIYKTCSTFFSKDEVHVMKQHMFNMVSKLYEDSNSLLARHALCVPHEDEAYPCSEMMDSQKLQEEYDGIYEGLLDTDWNNLFEQIEEEELWFISDLFHLFMYEGQDSNEVFTCFITQLCGDVIGSDRMYFNFFVVRTLYDWAMYMNFGYTQIALDNLRDSYLKIRDAIVQDILKSFFNL